VLQCTPVWQFEATQNRFLYSLIIISIFLACYHVAKNEKNCTFVGAPVRPNMLNMPKSASVHFIGYDCDSRHGNGGRLQQVKAEFIFLSTRRQKIKLIFVTNRPQAMSAILSVSESQVEVVHCFCSCCCRCCCYE